MAHLYLSLALVLFSLQLPEYGQSFRHQILVCSMHLWYKSPSSGVHQCLSAPTLTSGTLRLEAENNQLYRDEGSYTLSHTYDRFLATSHLYHSKNQKKN